MDVSNTLQCVWIARNLIVDHVYDRNIIDFLIFQALNNPSPSKEQSSNSNEDRKDRLVSDGINSVRGAAVESLILIHDNKFENEIFDTLLEDVFNNDVNSVKAAATYHFAYLMNINKERAFKLFLSIVSASNNEKILHHSIWSTQYLIHYDFEKLVPYFKKLLTFDNLVDQEIDNLSTILFVAWLYEYPDSENLFIALLISHPRAKSRAIHNSFVNFYFKEEISEKSRRILELIIEEPAKDGINRIELEFLHLDHIKFGDLYPILVKYVQSQNFKISDYFWSI